MIAFGGWLSRAWLSRTLEVRVMVGTEKCASARSAMSHSSPRRAGSELPPGQTEPDDERAQT